MKNQYFGDINDYKKYGLIRILSGFGKHKTAVCWMLTPDCGSTDGKFTDYLSKPFKYRNYNPALFDALDNAVNTYKIRNVSHARDLDILPNAVFFEDNLYDYSTQRKHYFEKFRKISTNADLIFFDPDHGIEVKSVKYGKYLVLEPEEAVEGIYK